MNREIKTLAFLFLLTGCNGFEINKDLFSASPSQNTWEKNVLSLESPEENGFYKGRLRVRGGCTPNYDVAVLENRKERKRAKCQNGTFDTEIDLQSEDGQTSIQVAQPELNDEYSVSSNFTKDSLPPELSIANPKRLSRIKNRMIANGFCEDQLYVEVKIKQETYYIDCEDGQFAATIPLDEVTDGMMDVTIDQTDEAGNTTSDIVPVEVDTTPPVLTVSFPTNGAEATGSLINVSGECESGFHVELSGAGLMSMVTTECQDDQFAASVILTEGAGTKPLTVSQGDDAGNNSMVALSITRIEDATPTSAPVISIQSPQDNMYTNNSTLTIAGTCTADLNVQLSGASLSSNINTQCTGGQFSTSVNLSATQGMKTVLVSQTNAEGVAGADSVSFNFDSENPTVEIVQPTPNSFQGQTVTLSGNCESGLDVTIGGNFVANQQTVACNFGTFQGNFNVAGGDGNKSIMIQQTDFAGNIGQATLSFIKDLQGPNLIINSPAALSEHESSVPLQGTCESGRVITVGGTGAQSVTQVSCSNNSFSSEIFLTDGAGTKTIELSQTDAAGNATQINRTFTRIELMPTLTGVELYNNNCLSCHGALVTSSKRNKSAQDILGAINSIGAMRSLSTLTTAEVDLIVAALSDTVVPDPVDPSDPDTVLAAYAPLQCDSTDPGKAIQQMTRLSKAELEATLTSIFGAPVVSNNSVQENLGLLKSDPQGNIANEFDNEIDDLDGLFVLMDSLTNVSFSQQQGFATHFPNCGSNPEGNACRNSVRSFLRKVYRRPASTEELNESLGLAESIGFTEEAFRAVATKALLSPHFHQHVEIEASQTDGGRYRLSQHEIANRIAYRLTGNPPDSQLMTAADSGQLATVAQLQSHAQRLIRSAQGQQHTVEFFYNWLRRSRDTDPNPLINAAHGISPQGLSLEMADEFDNYLKSVIFDQQGSFFDLYTNQTVITNSDRIEQLYGVTSNGQAVQGPAERSGFLLRALFTKSSGPISALVNRGVTIRRQVLCETIPSPDIGIVQERNNEALTYSHDDFSNRYIISEITKPNLCMGCHQSINPMGFAMESYDSFGGFRNQENIFDDQGNVVASHEIDTNVDDLNIVANQTIPVSGAVDLVEKLGKSSKAMSCFSQQVKGFQERRAIAAEDGCSINNMVDQFLSGAPVEQVLIDGVVQDDIFWRAIPQ